MSTQGLPLSHLAAAVEGLEDASGYAAAREDLVRTVGPTKPFVNPRA